MNIKSRRASALMAFIVSYFVRSILNLTRRTHSRLDSRLLLRLAAHLWLARVYLVILVEATINWFTLITLVVIALSLIWCFDRELNRSATERVDRLRFFLKTLQDRQEEFISLTEVVLREATERPIAIRRSSEISTQTETPTWSRRKPVDAFIGREANPRTK